MLAESTAPAIGNLKVSATKDRKSNKINVTIMIKLRIGSIAPYLANIIEKEGFKNRANTAGIYIIATYTLLPTFCWQKFKFQPSHKLSGSMVSGQNLNIKFSFLCES